MGSLCCYCLQCLHCLSVALFALFVLCVLHVLPVLYVLYVYYVSCIIERMFERNGGETKRVLCKQEATAQRDDDICDSVPPTHSMGSFNVVLDKIPR